MSVVAKLVDAVVVPLGARLAGAIALRLEPMIAAAIEQRLASRPSVVPEPPPPAAVVPSAPEPAHEPNFDAAIAQCASGPATQPTPPPEFPWDNLPETLTSEGQAHRSGVVRRARSPEASR